MDIAAQTGRDAARDDPERSTDRVSLLRDVVDLSDHLGRGVGIGTPDGRFLDLFGSHSLRVGALIPDVDAADRLGEAQDLDPEMGQQLARDAACSHARRGLSCRRTLQDVPDVGVPVLQGAGQVCVPRPQSRHRLGLVTLFGGGHLRRPVHVVFVFEHQRDGASDRHAAAHSAHDARHVGLDFLATPATVAALTAREIATQVFLGDLEPGRKSVDDHSQLRAVGFARGQPSQH